MRVIAGSAKGRKLKTLEGMEVRPTTDKVKEAVFSSIQFDLPGAEVLDLFSGSGQMGIEALSRGANHAVFVDRAANSLRVTRENLESLQFLSDASLHQFDIAILDPPYRKGILMQVLPLLESKMHPDGIVICEHETGLELPENVGMLCLTKQRKYSTITITTYLCKREEV